MDEEHELEQGKPIVILGANGSGKTRLGVKIEALNDPSFLSESYKSESFLVQRISAQKSLSISRAIVIRGEEVAERIAFTGHESGVIKNAYRYHDKPVTGLLDDFDDALSYLYAKNNKMLEDHNKQDLLSEKNGTLRPPALKTLVGRVESIWNALLPGRQIDLSGNEVHVSIDDGSARYYGMDMGDGCVL